MIVWLGWEECQGLGELGRFAVIRFLTGFWFRFSIRGLASILAGLGGLLLLSCGESRRFRDRLFSSLFR
jgi:hypothetical protein